MGLLSFNNRILTINNIPISIGQAPKPVQFCQVSSTGCGGSTACASICVYSPTMVAGETFCLCLLGNMSTTGQASPSYGCLELSKNGTSIYCCSIGSNICASNLNFSTTIAYGDSVYLTTYAYVSNTACSGYACSQANISGIGNIGGSFCIGSPSSCSMYTG